MTRPLIGITTEVTAAIWRDRIREAVLSPAACAAAVEQAGGQPVLLPPMLPAGPDGPRGNGRRSGRDAQPGHGAQLGSDPEPNPGAQLDRAAQLDRSAGRLIRVLDGVLLRAGPQAVLGGAWAAGQPVRPEVAAVAPQAALIRAAVDGGVPFLAVGAGLLALNLVTGGTLETVSAGPMPASTAPASTAPAGPPSASTASASPGSASTGPASTGPASTGPASTGAPGGAADPGGRTIELTAGSTLAGLLDTTSVTVTTRRPGRTALLGGATAAAAGPSGGRLRLGQLGRGLTAAGHGIGQAVLAVEVTGHPFGVGVAWHPEEDEDSRLLAGLLAAAAKIRRPAVQPA